MINNIIIKGQIICGIYKIVSPINRIYIGQSVNIYARWSWYIKNSSKRQPRLHRSFLKYGVENHKFEIIKICDLSELNYFEKIYSDIYNTFNNINGLNVRECGGSKGKLSEETKLKMSISHKNKIFSDEHKRKLSESHKGKKHSADHRKNIGLSHIGKKHSIESKQKMSKANTGKIRTKEMLINMSKAQTGKKLSDITKNKISLSSRGKKISDSHREKLRLYRLGRKLSKFHIESIKKAWIKRKYNQELIRQERAMMIF